MTANEAATQERRLAAVCLKLSYAVEALEDIAGTGCEEDARIRACDALVLIERVEATA